ncbi:MAG: type II secretion system GspH family protein [Puniceicoccales bacterium]|jgi:hypothetical protein|nr:type II secretion system GspH family protein [Puniceicoccales bacterium]
MKKCEAGFTLLEVALAIGIFTFAAALFAGWIGAQSAAESGNRSLVESSEIIEDFCAFIEVSSFDDIKALANVRATVCVTQEEEEGILYRKFIPNGNSKLIDGGEQPSYAVEIEPMESLFADENPASRPYIPLACKLFKIDKNFNTQTRGSAGEDFFTFITVKNY